MIIKFLKSNKNLFFLIKNEKNIIFFIKKSKKKFNDFFNKVKKIIFFFNIKFTIIKSSYRGCFKKIIDFLIKNNGR